MGKALWTFADLDGERCVRGFEDAEANAWLKSRPTASDLLRRAGVPEHGPLCWTCRQTLDDTLPRP